MIINFNDIYSKLIQLKPNIKISYLTADEFRKVANFPIKQKKTSEIHIDELKRLKDSNGICLIVLQGEFSDTLHGQPMKKAIPDILNTIPGIECKHIYNLNRKFAAVTSGLGQYGKNQLVYNEDFGFHHTIWSFLIYNTVINLPIRKEPNYQYLNLCNGCNECIKNCPAHAIHADEYPGWLDKDACQGFFLFGDHEYIPSIKSSINLFLGKPFTEEQLKQVQNDKSFEQLFGFPNTENVVYKDGKTYKIDTQYCKECKNQLPCRKLEAAYNTETYHVIDEGITTRQLDFS